MLLKEGRYKDINAIKDAWRIGRKEWTEDFGKELMKTNYGGYLRLEVNSTADYDALIQEDKKANLARSFSANEKNLAIQSLRNIVNYNYWRTRSAVEKEDEMVKAHRDIYEGKVELKRWKPKLSREKLEAGLNAYAKLLAIHKDLQTEDESVEEVMIAILAWQDLQRLLGSPPSVYSQPPLTDPSLRDFWNAHVAQKDEYQRLLLRELADISQKLQ